MKKYIFLTGLLLASGAMIAEDLPTFLELDVNGDGFLTSDELVDIAEMDITAVDIDSDGMLSLEEYSQLTSKTTEEPVEVPTE